MDNSNLIIIYEVTIQKLTLEESYSNEENSLDKDN